MSKSVSGYFKTGKQKEKKFFCPISRGGGGLKGSTNKAPNRIFEIHENFNIMGKNWTQNNLRCSEDWMGYFSAFHYVY